MFCDTCLYGISIIIFFKAPALECIFYDTWSLDIFWGTSSISKEEEDGEEREDTDREGPVYREVEVRDIPHMGIKLKAENAKLISGRYHSCKKAFKNPFVPNCRAQHVLTRPKLS